MPKKVAVLGSTGSIGKQTLEVLAELAPDYRVAVLSANRSASLMAEQAKLFKPELVVLSDPEAANMFEQSMGRDFCRLESGARAQVLAACWPGVELVVVALVGFSGFEPVVAALEAGKTVALANKEALVVGGELLKKKGLLKRGKLIPVDSEHSAIWQCLGDAPLGQVSRIWLTASGGPFRDWPSDQMEQVTLQQTLNHPNWCMGPKITVDSATLMNKGFEVLEAKWLFGLDLDQIRVVIHPQSIVHSAVEYIDGSIIAQLGLPDMRLPIQYALTYPVRLKNRWPKLNIFGQSWVFHEPDRKRFPCLDLAFRAGKTGGTASACLNAANEVAVEYFLKGKLSFSGIPEVIKAILDEFRPVGLPELEDIVAADSWARKATQEYIAG